MGDRTYAFGYLLGWGFFITIFGLALYDTDNLLAKVVGALAVVTGLLTLIMAVGVAVGVVK